MKALSLTRPWPWAIVEAGKRIENRCRRDGRMPAVCRHRGALLLHAAKSWDDDAGPAMVAARLVHPDRLFDVFEQRHLHPAGAIVASCWVPAHIAPDGRAYIDPEGYEAEPELLRGLDLRWWSRGYALVLADVKPTRVVPCRGHLGLWTVPDEVLEKLG